MKENFYFVSYNVALMASQALAFHYAQLGYHVCWTAFTGINSQGVEMSIFHDELTIINPPCGFMYSRKWEYGTEDTFWTKFQFLVAE